MIKTQSDIEAGVRALRKLDGRLSPVIAQAGPVPLRLSPASYETMAQIIISQLLSLTAAATITKRVAALVQPFDHASMMKADDDALRACGLSFAKIRTLKAVALEVEGGLSLEKLCEWPTSEAKDRLLSIKGIGPWSANVWLMFCAGHADIFPSGDIALQNAVQRAFALVERPTVKQLDVIAEQWQPHRAIAARLFWAYWRACRHGRDSAPLSTN